MPNLSEIEELPVVGMKVVEAISPITAKKLLAYLPEIFGGAEKSSVALEDVSSKLSAEKLFERDDLTEIERKLSSIDLPINNSSSTASDKFLPETASLLDVFKFDFDMGNLDTAATKVVGVKRYLNAAGQSAKDYIPGVMKSSDITFLGETHTIGKLNLNRKLGADIVGQLPRGSRLAIEVPASWRPVFDKFNASSGDFLDLPREAAVPASQQKFLQLLSGLRESQPDMVALWKSARTAGVKVVPVDAETSLDAAEREKTIASNLLSLSREDESHPVVAWFGNLHGARETSNGFKHAAQRVAESPDFLSGKKKLSTIYTEIGENETLSSMSSLTKKLTEAVAVPVRRTADGSPLGSIDTYASKISSLYLHNQVRFGAFDHLVLYPKM